MSGLVLAGAVLAQENSIQGHDTATAMKIPAACRTAEPPEMPEMNMESMMKEMEETQRSMMEGMMRAHGPMMQGMMAKDPDVAFACAMIPHHLGAIEMAEAELEHGDSEEIREMAQKMIDTQKRDIENLTEWIEQQAE